MKLLLIFTLLISVTAFSQPVVPQGPATTSVQRLDTTRLALTKMQKEEINAFYAQIRQADELRIKEVRKILDANHYNPDSVIFYGFRRDSLLFSVIAPKKLTKDNSKSKRK